MGSPILSLSNPARRVLELLRHGPMTVEDLASRMRLTANAVRNHLAKLQEFNLVVRTGSRPGTSKPSILYAITLEGQVQFSTIYVPVLAQFLRTAEEECTRKDLANFMTATGRELGKRYPKPSGGLRDRTKAAARLLKNIGGIPRVRSRNGSMVIESLACPLSALTAENAAACRIIEGLVSQYVGAPARTCCVRDHAPRCCFEIDKKHDQPKRA